MKKYLKECPFCGKVPDLDEPDTLYPTGIVWKYNKEFDRISYHTRREMPDYDGQCYSLNCPTHLGGCGAEIHGDSIEEVKERWERRVNKIEH